MALEYMDFPAGENNPLSPLFWGLQVCEIIISMFRQDLFPTMKNTYGKVV